MVDEIKTFEERKLSLVELGKKNNYILTFEQLAEALFSSIEMHSPALKIFLSNHGRAGFHLRFRDAFSEKVRLNLEKNESLNANLKVPMEYFLSFITSAFLGLIEQWVQNGLDKSPQEMTALYIDIIAFIQKK